MVPHGALIDHIKNTFRPVCIWYAIMFLLIVIDLLHFTQQVWYVILDLTVLIQSKLFKNKALHGIVNCQFFIIFTLKLQPCFAGYINTIFHLNFGKIVLSGCDRTNLNVDQCPVFEAKVPYYSILL